MNPDSAAKLDQSGNIFIPYLYTGLNRLPTKSGLVLAFSSPGEPYKSWNALYHYYSGLFQTILSFILTIIFNIYIFY